MRMEKAKVPGLEPRGRAEGDVGLRVEISYLVNSLYSDWILVMQRELLGLHILFTATTCDASVHVVIALRHRHHNIFPLNPEYSIMVKKI